MEQFCLRTVMMGPGGFLERTVRKFSSHEDADRKERRYYRSLTPRQRLEILLELVEAGQEEKHAARGGLARVYRIAELPSR